MGEQETLDFGRYSEAAVLILVSLSRSTKHGYAIAQDITEFSGSRISPATLYVVLSRLVERGFVEKLPEEGRQKPYRISNLGAAALDAKLEMYRRSLVAVAVGGTL